METDRVEWVPSRGGAPALEDLAAGGITMFTGSPIEGEALIEAGRVRPLAVVGSARTPIFPDVPTLKEAVGSDWTYENRGSPSSVPRACRPRSSRSSPGRGPEPMPRPRCRMP